MDLLNEGDIEEEIKNTIKGLVDREDMKKFNSWPNIQRTPYELEPKKRDSGSKGVLTKSKMGIAISIAIGIIGIGIGIAIGLSR